MDESAFRQARAVMAAHPCLFEKAMLCGACACTRAMRRNIAERESIACASARAHADCAALWALLRQNSAFALKLTRADATLPHAKAMKLQCGGLRGVQRVLEEDVADGPLLADVHALVGAARDRFGSLANLPYSAIVQSVVAHPIRRRRPQA